MIYEYPDTVLKFSCIAGKCPDTCCAGWEVDLDRETEEYYRYVEGPFGKRLRRAMKTETEENADGEEVRTCFFPLTDQNRCPFLNDDNLCEIITHLGPEAISVVCDEYPRYFEQIGNYQQMDMSLSCMEFGRIFFSSGPVQLQRMEDDTDRGWGDTDRERLRGILTIRDDAVRYLQDEDHKLSWREKMNDIERQIGIIPTQESRRSLMRRMERLEVIDHRWTEMLELVRNTGVEAGDAGTAVSSEAGDAGTTFSSEAGGAGITVSGEAGDAGTAVIGEADNIPAQLRAEFERLHEDCLPGWFTKLCVYFVFRYTLDIYSDGDPAGVFRYIDRSLRFLWMMCLAEWNAAGRKLTIEDMIDLAHLYSRQVEHCEENVAILKEDGEDG